jgi:Transcriptional regulator
MGVHGRVGRYPAPVPKPKREAAKTPPGLARLPPGRHGLPREFVVQNQRDRITAGTIAAVTARGYHETTISQIAAAAGLGRRTFYAYFSSKSECFLATYEIVEEHLLAGMREAGEGADDWPTAVAARLGAMLETFAANPDLAPFAFAVPQGVGGDALARYGTLLGNLRALIGEGRPANARDPADTVEESLIGGAAALIVRTARSEQVDGLDSLLPELTELMLTPYLGREEAARAASSQT